MGHWVLVDEKGPTEPAPIRDSADIAFEGGDDDLFAMRFWSFTYEFRRDDQ